MCLSRLLLLVHRRGSTTSFSVAASGFAAVTIGALEVVERRRRWQSGQSDLEVPQSRRRLITQALTSQTLPDTGNR